MLSILNLTKTHVLAVWLQLQQKCNTSICSMIEYPTTHIISYTSSWKATNISTTRTSAVWLELHQNCNTHVSSLVETWTEMQHTHLQFDWNFNENAKHILAVCLKLQLKCNTCLFRSKVKFNTWLYASMLDQVWIRIKSIKGLSSLHNLWTCMSPWQRCSQMALWVPSSRSLRLRIFTRTEVLHLFEIELNSSRERDV